MPDLSMRCLFFDGWRFLRCGDLGKEDLGCALVDLADLGEEDSGGTSVDLEDDGDPESDLSTFCLGKNRMMADSSWLFVL